MDHCIQPAGWHNWDKPENEQTACFYEYRYQSFSFLHFLWIRCYFELRKLHVSISLSIDHSILVELLLSLDYKVLHDSLINTLHVWYWRLILAFLTGALVLDPDPACWTEWIGAKNWLVIKCAVPYTNFHWPRHHESMVPLQWNKSSSFSIGRYLASYLVHQV